MPKILAALLMSLLALVACSDDNDNDDAASSASEEPAETTTTEAPAAEAEVLDILVTNDDGYQGEGLDKMVEALKALPDTEVTVVAPAGNQSGTGDRTTPGELVVTDVETPSGHPAKSVDGFPADTVNVAVDRLGLEPDLVISGINAGQNIGPFSEVSGTVGAAKQAVRKGIPALAASQGKIEETFDYATGVEYVLEWVAEHRDAILAGDQPVQVESLNIPTCPTGEVRDLIEVPLATDFGERDAFGVDCTSAATDPADDVDAFKTGYASLTIVPA